MRFIAPSPNVRRTPSLAAVTVAWSLVISGIAGTVAARAQPSQVIDRTLAIVGGQVVTLSDTRAAAALGLVDPPVAEGDQAAMTARLIERELVLREVQRYAPPAPTEAAVDARWDRVKARFPQPGAFQRALETTGFTAVRLRAWLRDDLRIQSYLGQRFAAAGTPTDQEVAAEYARRRAEFDRDGVGPDDAAAVVRENLAASRRQELIADWIADLRRRADIVVFPLP